VASFAANSVLVIDTSTNIVSDTIDVGANPVGVAITPVPGIGSPTNKSQGKQGGWKLLTIPRKFKIQGYCVSFVNVGN
jgi:YVTN family beta-propeller protein